MTIAQVDYITNNIHKNIYSDVFEWMITMQGCIIIINNEIKILKYTWLLLKNTYCKFIYSYDSEDSCLQKRWLFQTSKHDTKTNFF